jgi:hypothetical protein
MKRIVTVMVLVLTSLVVSAAPALGGEKWCEEDPVLTIDARIVSYTASFPATYVAGTTVNWTFHIPRNVLLAAAITPPALGSPAIHTTVRIVRDLPAYWLLSRATVTTTVTFSSRASFPTRTSVQGLNAAWSTYAGLSNRVQTFSTGYSLLPLLF